MRKIQQVSPSTTFQRGGAPCTVLGANPREIAALVSTDVTARIRQVLKDHAHLGTKIDSLSPSADLYQAGMTSHASVNVMLALEGEFEIEFPDHMLKRSMFDSIASIQRAVEELTATA